MRATDLDTVFLDAGNTLIGMDLALLAEIAGAEGVATTPGQLGRAEVAARPALSRRLAAGGSSEAGEIFVFYVGTMLECLGVPPAERTVLAPRMAAAARRVPTVRLWSRVLPGVPEALAALRGAGLRLVVVSNSDGTVEEGLERVGLRAGVDAVVDSRKVGAEKPDPRIFAHALALAGSVPARTLHVGDLYAVDVLGARAAGLRAVLLDPHGDWDGVDCDRVTDLAALAARLLG